ncbi:MAG: family 20 glycosylhydrolase [Actinophytocola sp.]|nr:family 20 glycosylhydrolase [Actinophytocola sp.]
MLRWRRASLTRSLPRSLRSSPVRAPFRVPAFVALLLLTACTDNGFDPRASGPASSSSAAPTTTERPPAVELADDNPALTDIIPVPSEAKASHDENLQLQENSRIVIPAREDGAKRVGNYLAGLLRPATGFALPVGTEDAVAGDGPVIELAIADDDGLGKQGYRLDVAREGVTITAEKTAGLFSGAQTLRQLLPPDIEQRFTVERTWGVAGGTVVDRPRFGYRGTMLDVARHFFDADEVKRHIDRIAQYKINYLHLHLTDDQGWRIEIDGWPKLTTAGGKTQVGGGSGGFYTQEQYGEIVAYAEARGVTIVPEVDMPGHTNAALNAYPELSCDGKTPPPYTDTQVGFSSLCIGEKATYRFAKDVIDQLAEMTPGPYLHIGGDEADSTTDADYRRFFGKVLPMITDAGKRPVGWHEYAKTPLPKSAVVQYWRVETSNKPARKAAAAGNRVLMSPANKTYLDMKYAKSDSWGNKWAGPVGVRDAYDWDPARALDGVGEDAVLGVETPLWTELVETEKDIERMVFPRIQAIAELGWSAQERRDWQEFSSRLAKQAPRMSTQGIGFHRSPEISW